MGMACANHYAGVLSSRTNYRRLFHARISAVAGIEGKGMSPWDGLFRGVVITNLNDRCRNLKRRLCLLNIMPMAGVTTTHWWCSKWRKFDMPFAWRQKLVDALLIGHYLLPPATGNACELSLASQFSLSGGTQILSWSPNCECLSSASVVMVSFRTTLTWSWRESESRPPTPSR